jgi:thioredoxin 1
MPIKEMISLEDCQQTCTQMENTIIVLDFTATWCGPCKRIYPLLENLSNEYPNVAFFKIDIDKLSDVASYFQIQSVPSFKFIFNNRIVASFAGADAQKLSQTIKNLVNELY